MFHIASPHAIPMDAPPFRDSFGGHPFLPADLQWPICPASGKRMVLFFQFDVRAEFSLAVAPGSHLVAFMSPAVNEITTFDFVADGTPLPDRFWEKRLQHFKVFLFGPEVPLVAHPEVDPYLMPQRLTFSPSDDPDGPFLLIGGEPRWYQDSERHPGFQLLCQLPEDLPFPKRPEAPEQPDSFSGSDYCLFLGNAAYFFARPRPTHPEEVWVVLQN